MPKPLRHKLLDSENHIGEDMGDRSSFTRADIEDALVQALDDTHLDSKLDAFRAFLRRYGRDLWAGNSESQALYLGCMSQDGFGWLTVHALTCELRRMGPRWEHSANWLLQHGWTPGRGEGHLYT